MLGRRQQPGHAKARSATQRGWPRRSLKSEPHARPTAHDATGGHGRPRAGKVIALVRMQFVRPRPSQAIGPLSTPPAHGLHCAEAVSDPLTAWVAHQPANSRLLFLTSLAACLKFHLNLQSQLVALMPFDPCQRARVLIREVMLGVIGRRARDSK